MAGQPLPVPSTAEKGPKNIVICCDGTGNEFSAPNPSKDDPGGGYNSNVVKLYTALCVDNAQVAYYHPGVGTMGAPTARYKWTQEWTKIMGLAFGAGFRDNVFDAYRYLMDAYNDNDGDPDHVYLFGFSRGAYTVRALAGMLHGYGLLCRGNEGHLPYAWRMYLAQHDNRKLSHVQPDDAFRETFSHRNFKIHFVGVWDTVSSVGWITSPLRLFNVAVNATVRHARQAVSIDEHRCFFQDNLWAEPTGDADVIQAWFAGVHSDVGGSYLQPQSGLADITLHWMLAEAKAKGLRFDTNGHEKLIFGETPTPRADMELFYNKPISWKLHNSLRWAWWIPEFIPHIYFNTDYQKEYCRVPLGLRLRQLPPNSLVHPSVRDHMLKTPPGAKPYHPRNCHLEELQNDANAPIGMDELEKLELDELKKHEPRRYLRYVPKGRRKSKLFFSLLDRFVVTWLFAIFDVVILLPLLLAVALALGFSVCALLLRLVLFLWHLLPASFHRLLHHLWQFFLDWLLWLGYHILQIVHWIWYVKR